MVATNQTLSFDTRKASSASFQADMLDEDGEVVPGSTLQSLLLTLKHGASVINGRNAQDVKNTNGCTIDEKGHLIWTMDPRDNPVNSPSLGDGLSEQHKATFVWTWAGGSKQGQIDILLNVIQNTDVPNAP